MKNDNAKVLSQVFVTMNTKILVSIEFNKKLCPLLKLYIYITINIHEIDRCMLDPIEDNRCRGLQRYFYNKNTMTCDPFPGSGTCPPRGKSINNFGTLSECERNCRSLVAESKNINL